ncbi:putative ABC transport system permease protein [Clostridium algidicarnis DSM 15099]|uniref:Putative ABC transport system permease protein n=2 Tax=Clostridium algidicarnis TaxID=37659 RepID=A0A2S6FXH9_9CLOT|nr:putative ABC transport system permease protein [Clostridium algidicarnis DSM 15099]
MRLTDLLEMIWKNLWKRRSRTIFTMIGVIIGSVAIFTIISLGNGFKKYITDEIGSVFDTSVISVSPAIPPSAYGAPVTPDEKKLKTKLDKKAIKDLKSYSFVKSVIPKLNDYGNIEYKKISTGASITGMPMKELSKKDDLLVGRYPTDNKNEAILGYKMATLLLDYKPTDKVDSKEIESLLRRSFKLNISNNGMMPGTKDSSKKEDEHIINLTIVGISKENAMDDFTVKVPLSTVEDIKKWKASKTQNDDNKEEGYTSVEVVLKDTNKIDEAEKTLKENGYQINSFKEIQGSIGKLLDGVKIILAALAGISLLVAAFGITNTMNMAIYERKKEIGIMKVIGGSVNDIKKVFVGEACTIGLMGGTIGLTLGFIANFLINMLANAFITKGQVPKIKIASASPGLILFILLFSTLVGFLSGVVPASKAAKLDVISSIKEE